MGLVRSARPLTLDGRSYLHCSSGATWFGGSNRQSQQVVQESKYSETEGVFKRKSVLEAYLKIAN